MKFLKGLLSKPQKMLVKLFDNSSDEISIPASEYVGRRNSYIFTYKGSNGEHSTEEIIVEKVYVSHAGHVCFSGYDVDSDDYDFLHDYNSDLDDLRIKRKIRYFTANDVL